jgi:beta-N-acetylhexosaminidase
LIPIGLDEDARLLAIMPRPADLTPADTSSLVAPGLAEALRRHHRRTTELVVNQDPSGEVADAIALARGHDLVVVGTIDAGDAQGALVEGLLATGVPTVAVALRTPYDLARYPTAPVSLCSYGILPPTMEALVAALFGSAIEGRLPVAIPGLYPIGHGIQRPGRRGSA